VLRFAPGSGLKLAQLRFVWAVKAGNEKKAGRNLRSRFIPSAKRQCTAAGRCFALSLTAGAPPQLRARSRYFALDFFA